MKVVISTAPKNPKLFAIIKRVIDAIPTNMPAMKSPLMMVNNIEAFKAMAESVGFEYEDVWYDAEYKCLVCEQRPPANITEDLRLNLVYIDRTRLVEILVIPRNSDYYWDENGTMIRRAKTTYFTIVAQSLWELLLIKLNLYVPPNVKHHWMFLKK